MHRRSSRVIVAALAACVAASCAIPAFAADDRCSHDNLVVGDTTLGVTLCATPGTGKTVDVAETFSTKSATTHHTTTIDVLPGETSSRGIDDVPLAPLGLNRTLHLTMRYRASAIALEHALLLPGAVPLK